MKVKKVSVMTEHVVYIACDGTEFMNGIDCKQYEDNLARLDAQKVADGIPKFDLTPEFEHDYESTWKFVYVRTAEELDSLKKVYFIDDAAANGYSFDQIRNNVPCWIIMLVTDSGYGEIIGTIDEIKLMFSRYIKFVENKASYLLNEHGDVANG